jgi:hypothetical protein
LGHFQPRLVLVAASRVAEPTLPTVCRKRFAASFVAADAEYALHRQLAHRLPGHVQLAF